MVVDTGEPCHDHCSDLGEVGRSKARPSGVGLPPRGAAGWRGSIATTQTRVAASESPDTADGTRRPPASLAADFRKSGVPVCPIRMPSALRRASTIGPPQETEHDQPERRLPGSIGKRRESPRRSRPTQQKRARRVNRFVNSRSVVGLPKRPETRGCWQYLFTSERGCRSYRRRDAGTS